MRYVRSIYRGSAPTVQISAFIFLQFAISKWITINVSGAGTPPRNSSYLANHSCQVPSRPVFEKPRCLEITHNDGSTQLYWCRWLHLGVSSSASGSLVGGQGCESPTFTPASMARPLSFVSMQTSGRHQHQLAHERAGGRKMKMASPLLHVCTLIPSLEPPESACISVSPQTRKHSRLCSLSHPRSPAFSWNWNTCRLGPAFR